MRKHWSVGLLLFAGCFPGQMVSEEPPTRQVASAPFPESRGVMPTKVNYAPASAETSFRVVMIKDKLIGENPQLALKPSVTAVGSAEPEIFHLGLNQIFITEGLVRQCQTEGQLAAVLAYELGRMVSEREANVSDEIRQPERPLPIALRIGSNGNARDADPLNHIELAQYEKLYPKNQRKLTPPNPLLIARGVLDRAGYQRTDLNAAMPALENAERFHVLENQFKGTMNKQ